MARGKEARTRDPHRRFAEWLETNSDDDPPRDLAVHAAVCVACQQRIAALDMLTAIDPALAGMPPVLPVPVAWWPRTVGRAAVVAGGVAALTVVGVGSWRLIEASNLVGPAVESPTQAVLGGTGAPAPTPPPSHAGFGSAVERRAVDHGATTDGATIGRGAASGHRPADAAAGPAHRSAHGAPHRHAAPADAGADAAPHRGSHSVRPRRPRRPSRRPRRRSRRGGYLSRTSASLTAAWAAASRATGTRNGEQET